MWKCNGIKTKLQEKSKAWHCAAALFLCVAGAQGASLTINGPASLQTDAIAITTTTYNATLTPSSFFPGSFTINLTSKKPPIMPVCPKTDLCELDKDIALMVTNSTWTYVYGFASGMQKERNTDLETLRQNEQICVDDAVCINAMEQTYGDIFQQNLSTPIVINVP